jgi:hypothetical protein
MASTPEGIVKKRVKDYLDSIGAWHFLPVSNGMGRHGIPDILACINGRFYGIECKARGKRANTSALQERELAGIAAAGGVAVVVDHLDQLKEVMGNAAQRP